MSRPRSKTPKPEKPKPSGKRPIVQYTHEKESRVNNPPVGLVDAASDAPAPNERVWAYDPHLDPQLQWDRRGPAVDDPMSALRSVYHGVAEIETRLEKDESMDEREKKGLLGFVKRVQKDAKFLEKAGQPYLNWSGKAERTSFEVPTVSLHVHERIDPRSILEAVRKKNGSNYEQLSLWNDAAQNPPLRDAIEFYQHRHGWTNRLVAGDSLLVMNSLIEKEGLAGKVQCLYFDPPYGIRYGSNFQPFVNKRDVKDGKDEDLTAEPEMIKAFRDTWELGLHSYLSYLRDRLLLARELLTESGSVFVQISDENVHHVREIMDEVFGAGNYLRQIVFRKTTGKGGQRLDNTYDILLWYAKTAESLKYRALFEERRVADDDNLRFVQMSDGTRRKLTLEEVAGLTPLPQGARVFRPNPLTNQRPAQGEDLREYRFEGKVFRPGAGTFRTDEIGMKRLETAGRLMAVGNTLTFVRYLDDFPFKPNNDIWDDTRQSGFGESKAYVVQTATKVLQRCLLMTTDPGDLVLDITCGSGTTAMVAEQWGRRWMTCDTSRVALTLAKQRLMTSVFDYYQLAHPDEGVGSGFLYKKVPHVTLKSIANNEPPTEETLYDQPIQDARKARVCGPFTVEAVPAPVVSSIGVPPVCVEGVSPAAHASGGQRDAGDTHSRDGCATPGTHLARTGETLRQEEWRSELLRTGIRGKGGQYLMFSRVEPLPGTRWLHAEAETRGSEQGKVDSGKKAATDHSPLSTHHSARRAVISFGPAHAPLEQRQVEQALEEAHSLVPKPSLVVFAAFQFDPEAAKDIDETRWPGVTLLKAQMNSDMLTDDLKKKRASNESFWMVGQPDVHLRQIMKGDDSGLWECEVLGFDYFNPKSGEIESGGPDRIAVWMLDTDYDGRSLFPRQVFFPMAGEKEGWARLAKNLKAEIDDVMIEAYRGTLSVPFELGKHRRVAVKIVDDRGIESLKIVHVVKWKD